MKHMTTFLSFCMFFLTACADLPTTPSATAPIGPTGTIAVQLAPSDTPSPAVYPVAWPDAIATAIPSDGHPSSPCLFLVDAKTLASGLLQVVYTTDCVSEDDATPKKLWRWVEGQGPAVAFPLPEDALEPYPSGDQEWILFRRDVADQEKEIWAIGSVGQDERRLAAVSMAEAAERYPGVFRMVLEYGWVGDSHHVVYRVQPQYELDAGAYDALALVDAETGESRSLAQLGEVIAVAFSPHGDQIAALTPDELRLIDSRSGELQFGLSLAAGTAFPGVLQYSPAGEHLVIFASEGIALVDAAQGTYRILPIEFSLWGAGDTPLARPAIHWAADDTFFLATLRTEIVELFEGEIEIWRVDAEDGAAAVVQRFTGFYPSVVLAPDSGRLLYQKIRPENIAIRELYLLDLATGEQSLYAEGEISLTSWSPDAAHFLFTRSEPAEGTQRSIYSYYLGGLGKEPRRIGESLGFLRWADGDRFLTIQRTADGVDELWLHSLDGTSAVVGSSQPERGGIR